MIECRIGCGKINFSIENSGRRDHPAKLVIKSPLFLPAGRIQSVELRVPATGVNDAVHNRRRRLKANLIVNERIFAAVETPFLFAALRINGVKVTVPAANEYCVVGERRRRVDDIAGFEFPIQLASVRVQTIDMSVAASEINRAINYHRT